MTTSLLGCIKDAPLWFWSGKNPGSDDFILDFVETFAAKYLRQVPMQTANIYTIIRAISDYRNDFGTNQTTRLSELQEENNVQKCLNVVMGLQNISNEAIVRQRQRCKLEFDDEDESVSLADNYPLLFSRLPSEEASTQHVDSVPAYLLANDHTHLIEAIRVWWFKSNSRKLGLFNTKPAVAKQIIKEHGCLCRYLIRIQSSVQRRQTFESAIFAQIVQLIESEIIRQRTASLDIFSIEYKVFKNIPFFVDHDLIKVMLNRRHSSVISNGLPRFVGSDDDPFLLVYNGSHHKTGWDEILFSLSDSDTETNTWVKRNRTKKSKRRRSSDMDFLHARLGSCSIEKRNVPKTNSLEQRKTQIWSLFDNQKIRDSKNTSL